MAVTITQVAREAGVSPAVVSRLLRNDQTLRVSPTTRERVLAVHKRLGSPRPSSARSSGRVPCHAVVLFNRKYDAYGSQGIIDNPFFRAFEKVLEAQGGWLSVVFFDEQKRVEVIRKLIRDGNACHALLLRNELVDEPVMELLCEHRFPHVSMDPAAVRFPINTLGADEQGGLRQALEHLRALGHERVAYIGQRWRRYSRFAATVIEMGLPFEEQLFCEYELPDHTQFDRGGVAQCAGEAWRNWLEHHPSPPTAVCCHNDYGALGVMRASREMGLEPGRDISIIGYDNVAAHGGDHAPEEAAALTSLDNPVSELGAYAAEWLLAQTQQPPTQMLHIKVPMELVVRDSTGPAPGRASESMSSLIAEDG